jgi:hypothetical protein
MKRASSLLWLDGKEERRRRRPVEVLPNGDSNSRGDEWASSFCCGVGGIARLMTTPRDTTTTSSTSTTSANPLVAAELIVDEEHGDPMDLVAKEMYLLSLQEREKAYEDIHGVSAMVHETPELTAASLQTMEHYLQSITSTTTTRDHKPSAYQLALVQNRHDYVQDAKLRLMFLRAERFHVEKAANRLLRWLDWKLELFGIEKLCQAHIGLAELNADARFMVETGMMQLLPARDNCDRLVQVVAYRYHRYWNRSSKALLQMFFYMAMIAAEDEMNQKNGVVNIIYALGKEQPPLNSVKSESELSWSSSNKQCAAAAVGNVASGGDPIFIDEKYEVLGFASLTTCLPVRWDAMHYLTTSRVMQFVPALYTKTMGWHVRARLRVHIGSHLECQYGLLTFGVPSTLLPFTVEGELKTNNHKKWIQRRLVKDRAVSLSCHHPIRQPQKKSQKKRQPQQQPQPPHYPSSEFVVVVAPPPTPNVFSGIDLPCRNDVLLGQGQPIQDHAGNRHLQELLEANLDEYNNTPKDGGRADLARKIIFEIKHSSSCGASATTSCGHGGGARFLQFSSKYRGWWEEVTEEEALILNVCNRFRNVRKRKILLK